LTNFTKTITEPITHNEVVSRVWTLARSFSDSLTIIDPAVSRIRGVLVSLTETITHNEIFSKIAGLQKTLTDSITHNEILTTTRNVLVSLSETLKLNRVPVVLASVFTLALTEVVALVEKTISIGGRFWVWTTKNVSTWTKTLKNTSTWSKVSKNVSSWTNIIKHQ
jgi:hypothetical protein